MVFNSRTENLRCINGTEHAAMRSEIAVYNSTSKNRRYFETIEALNKATVVANRILAAKDTAQAATDKLKPIFEARWTSTVQAYITVVLKFDDKMLPDLAARMDRIFALRAKI